MKNNKRRSFIYSLSFALFIFIFYLWNSIKAGEILTVFATIVFITQIYRSLSEFREYYIMDDEGIINKSKEKKINNIFKITKDISIIIIIILVIIISIFMIYDFMK